MPDVRTGRHVLIRVLAAMSPFLPFLYDGVALLLLGHWDGQRPWFGLDWIGGGYFLISVGRSLLYMGFRRAVASSRDSFREASGAGYDRFGVKAAIVLALGELLIFADYGHWHLMPVLRTLPLQIAGMTLYAASSIALFWTDTFLMRYFGRESEKRGLLTGGPFSVVRHPRYTCLLLSKFGFALMLASPLAWISFVVSIALVVRRIRLEEVHLHELFGTAYERYSEQVNRLIPRIY